MKRRLEKNVFFKEPGLFNLEEKTWERVQLYFDPTFESSRTQQSQDQVGSFRRKGLPQKASKLPVSGDEAAKAVRFLWGMGAAGKERCRDRIEFNKNSNENNSNSVWSIFPHSQHSDSLQSYSVSIQSLFSDCM